MDRYTRILVIIFLLCLVSLGLNFYMISKVSRPITQTVSTVQQPTTRNSPQAVPTIPSTPPSIQADLTQIKAEIRALRDSLESTGLISVTPEP